MKMKFYPIMYLLYKRHRIKQLISVSDHRFTTTTTYQGFLYLAADLATLNTFSELNFPAHN